MQKVYSALLIAFIASPATGHHSRSEYDFGAFEEVEGEVIDVVWQNPHFEMVIRANNSDGAQTDWTLEGPDIITLRRRGVVSEFFNVGDFIRVAGNPSTRRAQNMAVTHVLLPDGKEVSTSAMANQTPRWSADERIGFAEASTENAAVADGESLGLFRVWMTAFPSPAPEGFAEDLPLTDSAKAAVAAWDPANDPTNRCIASGMPGAMRLSAPHPIDLSDQGDRILLRLELFDIERTIFLTEISSSDERGASPLGYSYGRLEDDALVVQTSDVNWPYFDHMGIIPQSGAVEIIERFSLGGDGNTLEYELTVSDPATFLTPVTGRWTLFWRPDLLVEPFECVAQE